MTDPPFSPVRVQPALVTRSSVQQQQQQQQQQPTLLPPPLPLGSNGSLIFFATTNKQASKAKRAIHILLSRGLPPPHPLPPLRDNSLLNVKHEWHQKNLMYRNERKQNKTTYDCWLTKNFLTTDACLRADWWPMIARGLSDNCMIIHFMKQ